MMASHPYYQVSNGLVTLRGKTSLILASAVPKALKSFKQNNIIVLANAKPC